MADSKISDLTEITQENLASDDEIAIVDTSETETKRITVSELDLKWHPKTTVGIADNNLVEIDDADAADDDYCKLTTNGIEGRSASEVRTDVSVIRPTAQLTAIDYTTDCTTGDGKAYFRVPAELNGMNLVTVSATVITAGTTGTMDIQIYNVTQAADMLSTKITIDSAELDSSTAATPPVIDSGADNVSTADQLRIDVDAIHSGTAAKGLLVTMTFAQP